MFINCDPSTSTDRFREPKSSPEPCSASCSCDFHSYSHQRSHNSSYNTSNRPLLTSATLFPRYLQTSIIFCLLISTTVSRSAVSAKCYFFGPGTTIPGSDYRREYGITRKECAESCKQDICCMGFEFVEGQCTLKSKSLNGTIAAMPNAYFGLCLDFDDGERDRFYDHELGGKLLSSKADVSKETCMEFCGYQEEAIIFSWKTHDELNPEGMGHCECLSVLHSVRLSFGSTSGFLV
ncbi:unnamed protein product [Bursaphelenchus xylophilus]|uniref:(pine wood nematode) hypothetical protein n=1 Tax=Bursaphelenchus xylophilus TaxID=6326 RepID=A0A7I8WQW9_BURXY|nr:unnamed protein product [Bursaphelenchus xylophilus]CAG9097497.1 unnamed protein product [Bursaphelenchus xylophilus]